MSTSFSKSAGGGDEHPKASGISRSSQKDPGKVSSQSGSTTTFRQERSHEGDRLVGQDASNAGPSELTTEELLEKLHITAVSSLAAGKQLNTNFMDAARDFDINIGDPGADPKKLADVEIRKERYLVTCQYQKPRQPNYGNVQLSKQALERAIYLSTTMHGRMVDFWGLAELSESHALFMSGNETSAREGTGKRAASLCAMTVFKYISSQTDALPLVLLCDDLPNVDSTNIASYFLAGLFTMGTDTMSIPAIKEKPTYRSILGITLSCIKAQQQKTPVWCIIDCIDSIEDKDRRQGTLQFLKMLLQAAQTQSRKYPFCLLVTSGTDGHCSNYARSVGLDMVDCPSKVPKITK